MRISFVLLFIFCFSCKKNEPGPPAGTPTPELRGADLSFLPEVRASGITCYNSAAQPEDMLLTLKNAGVNLVRLRLWKDPATPVSGYAMVKTLSTEIKARGLKTLLSVHYSDTWADPGHQTKPAAWQSLPFAQLADSVYAYTRKIVEEIRPDYIQIGNEINAGLLWPEGSSANFAQMKQLLKKGIEATRAGNAGTKIILHYAGISGAGSFFAGLRDLDYDLIGLSYYPIWHGKDLGSLQLAIETLARENNHSVFLAETAYPFSLGWKDWTNNIVGLPEQLIPEYAATPEGQKAYLQRIANITSTVKGGAGFCYWGGEWVSYRGDTATNGSSWENQALWDFNFKSLPALEAY